MKRILTCLLAVVCASVVSAQKVSSSKVPKAVRDAFTAAHPNVQATWEKEKAGYEVNFKEAGKEMSCVLDAQGAILETETAIPVADLPQSVKDHVKAKYKNNSITEAAKIVSAGGEVTFEARVKKRDLLFDANGNFLKAVVE